ncbi:MAG: Uncharacterised protein [Prochlorococcus marinus str. MIT 9313]|nr:MAG: Uncharacterised protein [Prochlorococcus marinus str. MIT 9313]
MAHPFTLTTEGKNVAWVRISMEIAELKKLLKTADDGRPDQCCWIKKLGF